jgi:WhiB family redox-sensing transcriptional regulator
LTNWRNQAACRNEEPDLFFPAGATGPALLQIEEAKNVCRRCPVVQQCAAWALGTNQEHGVWGGYSETDRRRIRRGGNPNPRPAECGTRLGYQRHQRNSTTPCPPCCDAHTAYTAELERKKAAEKQRIAERADHMRRMAARGLGYRDIGARLGISVSLVCKTLRAPREQHLGEAA